MKNKFFKISLIILIFFVLFCLGAYTLLNTQYTRNYISVTIEKIVNSSIDQRFAIGRLEGDLFSGLTLKNVEFEVEGETFIKIEELSTNYSLPLLASVILRGDIPLYNTKITGVEVNLIKDENGIWNFKKLKKSDKEEDQEKDEKDDTQKKLFNLYLKDTTITKSKLNIINRKKDSTILFDIQRSDFSIDLIGLYRKFVLDSDDINLAIEPFGLIFENVSADALITKDNVAFKNLDLNFNDTHIQGQGIINNYSNPSFNINAYIDSLTPGDIGVFNLYIKTSGKSWEYKRFDAEMEVSLLNSSIRNKRIWTDMKKIEIKDTRAFLEGKINTEFGNVDIDGFLDLRKLLQDSGTNEFNVDANLSDLNITELLDVLKISTGDLTLSEQARIRSVFNASGKWEKPEDFSTSINFSSFSLTENSLEKLALTGQTVFSKNRMDLDIQSEVRSLDLSGVLKDFEYNTDINTDINFYGTIPFRGNIQENIVFNTNTRIFESRVNDLVINNGVIHSSYDKGILNINELELNSSDLSLSVEGKGTKENGLDLVYKVKSDRLEFINNLYSDLGLSGSIEADGTIIGGIDSPELSVVAELEKFRYRDLLYISSGDLNASTTLNSSMEGLDLTTNVRNIKLAGKKIEILQLLASKENNNIVSNVTSVMSGNRTLNASIEVNKPFEKDKTVKINSMILYLGEEQKITSNSFSVKVTPRGIQLDKPVLSFQDGTLSLEGNYTSGKSININGEMKKIDNSLISLLLASDNSYTGTTSGKFRITGNMQSPVITSDISSVNPGIDGYSLEIIQMSLDARNRNIDIDINSKGPRAGSIGLTGNINSSLDLARISENFETAQLNLELSASDFEITPVKHFVSEIAEIKGSLGSDLNIRGSAADPEIYGEINLSGTEIGLRSLSNPLFIDTLTIKGNKYTAKIQPSIIRSGEGEAELSGSLNLGNMTYALSMDLNGLQVRPKFISTKLSGELEVTGNENNMITITGDIKTSDTTITITEKQSREVKEIKFVDQDEEPEEFIISEDDDESFYTSNVALDMDISIPRDSWVKGKGANIEITGDIDVNKQFGESHVITGNIDVVRGQYIVFGKLFKIDDGSITFPSDGSLTPLLDLNVSHEISSVEVFINVRGKANKPKLDLSSNPPMEESDIISYVLFGTSRNNLGNEQRNVAGEIASNIAAGEVASFIGNRFGLDVFSVQGGEEGGLSDPQIKAGSYINPDIYIGYERTQSTLPGSENTINNNFILEWKLNESFSLESQIGGENSGVDLFYNFNF